MPIDSIHHFMPLLFAATILLSSFLLFLIQPLVAKQILPWFGGAAGVWTTCLLFFQALLLGGYVYAHAAVRYLRPRTHSYIHAALLVASLAAMPVIVDASWKPVQAGEPVWRILLMLTASIGLPYFVLSSTGPLVQVWYARTLRRVPYRLFALSNIGSLLALLAYPFAVEPWLAARTQAYGWSAAFAGFALLCAAAALVGGGQAGAQDSASQAGEREREAPAPRIANYATWMSLAALASYMLLAVSNHLTQNIASIPFLWIAPLVLYLASFILCFEGDGWYRRGPYLALLAAVLAAVSWWYLDSLDLWYAIPAHLAGLFVICMFCHGEVAAAKPDARYLTAYFLAISLGGVVGAILVAIVAPLILPGYFELGIGMCVCAAFVIARGGRGIRWVRPVYAVVLLIVLWCAGSQILNYSTGTTVVVRDFYGAYRVLSDTSDGETTHRLRHGSILHGAQVIDPQDKRAMPLTYYSPSSGIGTLLRALPPGSPLRFGMVGLGAGTVAAYGKPGDVMRFYEIDPVVVELARTEFHYLGESRARIEMVVGDARLSLEREPSQQFDVLAIDAFSGDAIPVHLLSAEALDLYLRHLKPGGALLFHVTNRYLDLAPVVARLAQDRNLRAALLSNEPDESSEPEASSSDWVLLSSNAALFEQPQVAEKSKAIALNASTQPWTDDFNNLLRVLR